jgi:hypothetical protein
MKAVFDALVSGLPVVLATACAWHVAMSCADAGTVIEPMANADTKAAAMTDFFIECSSKWLT